VVVVGRPGVVKVLGVWCLVFGVWCLVLLVVEVEEEEIAARGGAGGKVPARNLSS